MVWTALLILQVVACVRACVFRGVQAEKAMLDQQLEEVRQELSHSRDEEMRLVQETGRLQSQHTEQVSASLSC